MKYTSGLYYASGYLTANIYNYVFQAEEISEEEDLALTEAPDNWERATMNISFPFRFNMVSTVLDIQKYREELEGRRGYLQFQYSKESQQTTPSSIALDELSKRMRVIETRINRLGQGERPVTEIMYIESTAVGISEREAMDTLTSQLNQLQTVFNIFDLSITRIMGRELYYLHRMNYVVPPVNELMSTFEFQR